MPNPLQFNAQGAFPQQQDTSWMGGGLGGVLAGQQQDRARQMFGMQQQANQMSLEQQLMELQKARQLQESGIAAEMAKNRATAGTAERAAEATTGALETGTAKGKGTLQTDIEAANVKNKAYIDQDSIHRMERDLEKFNLQLPAFQGPTGMANFQKWADEEGWSKNSPYRSFLEGATGADDFAQRSQKVMQHATANLEQRRKQSMLQQKIEGEGAFHLEYGAQANASAERRAQIAADAARDAAETRSRAMAAKQDDIAHRLVTALDELEKAEKEGDKAGIAKAEAKIQRYRIIMESLKASGAQLYPSIPGAPITYGRPQGGPAPFPGTTQAPQGGNVIEYDAQGKRIIK